MLAVLNGVDAIVFTGGIGENSPDVRANACNRFSFLKLALDSTKNSAKPVDTDIASPESAVRILLFCAPEKMAVAPANRENFSRPTRPAREWVAFAPPA